MRFSEEGESVSLMRHSLTQEGLERYRDENKMPGHAQNFGNQPAKRPLNHGVTRCQTCEGNTPPFQWHFKMGPGCWAAGGWGALCGPRVVPERQNQQLAIGSLLTQGSDFRKIKLVLQDLIKFLLAVIDSYPSTCNSPRVRSVSENERIMATVD